MDQAVLDPLGSDAVLIIQVAADCIRHMAGVVDLAGFVNRALHIVEGHGAGSLRRLAHLEIEERSVRTVYDFIEHLSVRTKAIGAGRQQAVGDGAVTLKISNHRKAVGGSAVIVRAVDIVHAVGGQTVNHIIGVAVLLGKAGVIPLAAEDAVVAEIIPLVDILVGQLDVLMAFHAVAVLVEVISVAVNHDLRVGSLLAAPVGRTVIVAGTLIRGIPFAVRELSVRLEGVGHIAVVERLDAGIGGRIKVIVIVLDLLPAANKIARDGVVVLPVQLKQAGAHLIHITAGGADKLAVHKLIIVSGCG